jgi:hypothetical protein
VFFESNWQFIDEDDPEFKCWVTAVKFAQFVFPVDFGAHFCRVWRVVAEDFLAKFTDPIDFVRVLLDDLKFQEHLEGMIFGSKSAMGQLRRAVYDAAFENPNGVVDQLMQEVSKSLVRRESELVSLVYSVIAFCQPSPGTLTKLATAAKAALAQEQRALVELSGTITWYVDLIKKSLGNSILHEFQSDLIEFLAVEKKSVFRDLLKFIENQARTNGDLSEVFPVLLYLPGKAEFDVLYIRNAVRRLLPPSESHIEIEKSFANSIRKLSPNFELRGLSEILHEAQVSLELHLGPVLLVPSGLWPFRIQKVTPVALAGYCRSINERYSQLFPTRILSFPIVEWVVHVKDRVTHTTFVANGVQAEVLLYLNEHTVVTGDSFEPSIPSSITNSALTSLSTTRIPVLLSDNGRYSVNKNLKKTGQTIKLPRQVSVEAGVANESLGKKDETIDANLVRIMKGLRITSMARLEGELKLAVAERFAINHQEIRDRVRDLVARNLIDVQADGTVLYIP